MRLIKVREVAKLPGTPSPEAIYRVFRRPTEEWPSFVHLTDKGRKAIDVSDPSWAEYLARRSFAHRVGDKTSALQQKVRRRNKSASKAALKNKKPKERQPKDLNGLVEGAARADYEKRVADTRTAKYRAESEETKLQLARKNVVDTKFARHAFFGYWSRINTELTGMRHRIGERIKNMVRAGDIEGVLNLMDAEHEKIIRNVMEQHKQDLEKEGIDADY